MLRQPTEGHPAAPNGLEFQPHIPNRVAVIKASVNSDDPAYFRAYMNDNFIALQEEGKFGKDEIVQLSRNAFEVAWIDEAQKQLFLQALDDYVAEAA